MSYFTSSKGEMLNSEDDEVVEKDPTGRYEKVWFLFFVASQFCNWSFLC